jgi:uncharacterized Zn finger protein
MTKSVIEWLLAHDLHAMALPSNFRYGSATCHRGAVEFLDIQPNRVEAWAGGLDGSMVEGGGTRRRVELTLAPEGLKWHCTGNPKNHQIFCKHCVAVALAVVATKTQQTQ